MKVKIVHAKQSLKLVGLFFCYLRGHLIILISCEVRLLIAVLD